MRRYTMKVNGRSYEIDVEEQSPDTFRVLVEGRILDVRLDEQVDLGGALTSPGFEVRDASSMRQRTRRAEDAAPSGRDAASEQTSPATLSAPMPGTIIEVVIAHGAAVRRGDALVVLEAMKMKNTLRAPRDAVVAEVCVSEGTQVNHGDPLVRFEV